MTGLNGEAYSIRRGNAPITPENLTSGAPALHDSYGLTGEAPRLVVQPRSRFGRVGRAPRSAKQPATGPESRNALRSFWKNAQKTVESMETASAAKDLMQLANAADELDSTLAEFWKLRQSRDINWQTILNHVQ